MKSSKNVLIDLYNNAKVRTKVDNALDTGSMTYDEIIEFCEEHGISLSRSSITRYKQKREEAANTGEELINLLDQRRKTGNIVDIRHERDAFEEEGKYAGGRDTFEETFDTVEKVYNDIEFLDEIIQKSFNGLKSTEIADLKDGMRAVEIKDKLTGGSMNGLSLVGLRELKLRMQARESSIAKAIIKFIPEEQHEEVEAYIDQVEQEFYDNLDLTEEDKRVTEALKQAGFLDN